jgi:predicted dehydrogenase
MAVSSANRMGIAVIGAGYWGPNLIRNFSANTDCNVVWVCDLSRARAERAVGHHSTIRVTNSIDDVLGDPRVAAVALATPTATHASLATRCLKAGKHVLLEKPLAGTLAEGEDLVALADRRGLVLMCDHTYCYTPAVMRMFELVSDGALGEIQYIDSVRVNLGLVQPDVDVFWDLAPHDLAILDLVLPEDCRPTAVAAQGADPIGAGRACVGYLTLPLPGNAIAHCHVNWLSPTKIRTMIIGGSKRMLVWDDLNPLQRVTLYDRGVDLASFLGPQARRETLISYRIGDIVAPALPEHEALQDVVREFVAAIREDRAPLTDGRSGLRVLAILEAASLSLANAGHLIRVADGAAATTASLVEPNDLQSQGSLRQAAAG